VLVQFNYLYFLSLMSSLMFGGYRQQVWTRSDVEQSINEDLREIGNKVSNLELFKLFREEATSICKYYSVITSK
jgi:hypothetical protein